jgi:hypothetical protein
VHEKSSGHLIKQQDWFSGRHLKSCISNKFPGDGGEGGLWATLWVAREWSMGQLGCSSGSFRVFFFKSWAVSQPYRIRISRNEMQEFVLLTISPGNSCSAMRCTCLQWVEQHVSENSCSPPNSESPEDPNDHADTSLQTLAFYCLERLEKRRQNKMGDWRHFNSHLAEIERANSPGSDSMECASLCLTTCTSFLPSSP